MKGTGRWKCWVTSRQGERNPRNFGIDPTGTYLLAANQDTNDIFTFTIDGDTGSLTPCGQVAQVPRPVCLKFVSEHSN